MKSQIIQEFGHDSDEYKKAWNNIHSSDLINQVRVELLFQNLGHPKKDNVGEALSSRPLMVIHHAQDLDIFCRFLYGL